MPDINQHDKNNERHGEWVTYWYNGQLHFRENYLHGIYHGFFEVYDRKGEILFRGHYNMDKEIGHWITNGTQKTYYLWVI